MMHVANVLGPANLKKTMQAGAAFRWLDDLGIIRAESFIIVDSPIVVSNADLTAAIASHQARAKEDACSILTMIMKPGSIETSADPSHVFHITKNETTGRILSYVRLLYRTPSLIAHV